jgi:hypothetical protein
MGSGRSNLDRDEGIECSYGSFKWRQIRIFVRECSEKTLLDPQAYTDCNVFLRGFVPCIAEGLRVEGSANITDV